MFKNPLEIQTETKDGGPGGLPSLGSHRVGHDRSDLAAAAAAKQSDSMKTSFRRTHLVII